MTIAVDVDLLRQHRLALLAEADELEGSSSGHVRELADALERWLGVAHATDGEVGLGLDLLTAQVLAL